MVIPARQALLKTTYVVTYRVKTINLGIVTEYFLRNRFCLAKSLFVYRITIFSVRLYGFDYFIIHFANFLYDFYLISARYWLLQHVIFNVIQKISYGKLLFVEKGATCIACQKSKECPYHSSSRHFSTSAVFQHSSSSLSILHYGLHYLYFGGFLLKICFYICFGSHSCHDFFYFVEIGALVQCKEN